MNEIKDIEFSDLQKAINLIWRSEPKEESAQV